MAGDHREPWTHVPEPLRSSALAEYDLVETILAQIRQHPDQDPMQNLEVKKIARIAFNAWQVLNTDVLDFDDYLEQTPVAHEDIAMALGRHSIVNA